MFGLSSPLREFQAAAEFDNVNKIVSQSSFQEPVYQTSPHLAKANENGELFLVEVERNIKDTDSDITSDVWGDNQSLNSRFPCSTSEDTGYSSDTEIQHSPKSPKSSKNGKRFSQLWKKKEIKLFSEGNIDDSLDSASCDCVECKPDAMTNIKDVLLLVAPYSQGKQRTNKGSATGVCEHMLGIVPGYQGQQLPYNGVQEPVYIKALSPDGPAIKVKDIRIGDWLKSLNGHEVTRNNLDVLLSSVTSPSKVRITLQSMPALQSIYRPKQLTSTTDQLVSMVTGEEVEEEEDEKASVVLYMSLDGLQSDEMKGKDDLVYHYPENEGLLLAMRGMFYTLCHTVKDFTHNNIQHSTIAVKDEVYNLCYHVEGKDLLVFAVSHKRISQFLLGVLKDEVVRLVQVLFGSVESAFKCDKNHRQLDHILGVVLKCGIDSVDTSSIKRLLSHTNQVQYLPLPSDVMLNINNILSEFEAGDFVDMSDSYYGLRRSYTILGSCLYYKDYLISSHLNKEHLTDINLYLHYHGLLPLTTRCPLNQLVIWREVFPTLYCSEVSGINNVFGYSEPDARWFLLVVGLKSSIFAVLLEAGGCSVRRHGATLPDPFYIDQAKSTLLQTLGSNITSIIESRLQGNGMPLVANVDNVHQKDRSSSNITFPLTKAGIKKQDDGDMFSRYPKITSPRREIFLRKTSIDSDASSGSSNDSLFKSSRTSRLFGDLQSSINSNGSRWVDDSTYKFSQGADNCVFNFCYLDGIEGVYVGAMEKSVDSVNQTELISNFHRCCSQIRQIFHDAKQIKKILTSRKEPLFYPDDNLVDMKEHGVLFTLATNSLPDNKKQRHSLSYWVVGRKLMRGMRREIYVCFLDSTPQNLIEAAFQLGFSKTCF